MGRTGELTCLTTRTSRPLTNPPTMPSTMHQKWWAASPQFISDACLCIFGGLVNGRPIFDIIFKHVIIPTRPNSLVGTSDYKSSVISMVRIRFHMQNIGPWQKMKSFGSAAAFVAHPNFWQLWAQFGAVLEQFWAPKAAPETPVFMYWVLQRPRYTQGIVAPPNLPNPLKY